jgi:hypothetical protein
MTLWRMQHTLSEIRLHHSCRFVHLWISYGLIRFQEPSYIIEPNLKWMEEATSTLTSVFGEERAETFINISLDVECDVIPAIHARQQK